MRRYRSFIHIAAWFALIFTDGYCMAGVPADFMNDGNAAYRAGNWELAIDLYDKANVTNPDLFYNRANAHFKKGEIGYAILFYNRALKIKPRDKEIIANLEHARLLRTDKLETSPVSKPLKLITAPYRMLSANEHASLCLALLTALALLLCALIKKGPSRILYGAKLKNAVAAAAIALVIQLFVTGVKTWSDYAVMRGVIIDKSVSAFSAPAPGSSQNFELHAGTEVRLDRMENGFVLATLPSGWTGWIPDSAVEKI